MKKNIFFILGLLLIFYFIGLFLIKQPGPDLVRYMDWAQAFITNDIFSLKSSTGSAQGFPVFTWSPGAGLFFALPKIIFPFLNLRRSVWLAGWLASILFWLIMIAILRKITRRNTGWLIFGLLLIFIGTPIGYYSSAYASEIFTSCLVAGLLYFSLQTCAKARITYSLGIGVSMALLVMTRFLRLIYFILPLTVIIVNMTKDYKSHKKPCLLLLILPFILVFIGLVQVLVVNRWMTGSLFVSPYAFGNAVFKSMDYLKPEVAAVLFHSWHGLIPYHPLFILGFIILVRELIKAKTLKERIMLLAITLIIILNIYTYSAWHVWWLGMATFGARGLSPLFILLAPLLIKYLQGLGEKTFQFKILIILCLLTSFWSYFLLGQNNLQANTTTNFYTYESLVEAQKNGFLQFISSNFWWLTAYFSLIVWQFISRKRELLRLAVYSLGFLVLLYFKDQLSWRAGGSYYFLSYFLVFILLTLVFIKWKNFYQLRLKSKFCQKFGLYLTIFLAFILATTSFIFWRFAFKVEKMMKFSQNPSQKYHYLYPADLQEAKDAYFEYQNISGFLDKKEALRLFLIEVTKERFDR